MNNEKLCIHGFSRVQIEEDGKIVGDSGWTGPNQITNLGFQEYLVHALMSTASHEFVGFIALGSGSEPGAADTSLAGEVVLRSTAITPSVVSSKTAQFLATFNSGMSFVTDTQNLSNIGLFHLSSQGAGTIFAGNTYASSSCATNQSVNVTYQIRFSTS